jgi:hypothetical protein
MKLTCAAYLACAGLALAQGNDDLGLPQLNAPLAEAEPMAASGYFMQDGVVYAVVGEKAVPVDEEVTLRVTPRKIIGFDGRQMRMPVGMMYMADGTTAPLPVPQETVDPKPVVAPTPANTSASIATRVEERDVAPNVGTSSQGVSIPTRPLRPTDPLPPGPILLPSTQVTARSSLSSATIPPAQPWFASPVRPDRTGPLADGERPIDRTRPESTAVGRVDATRSTDHARAQDRTKQGPDVAKYRDRTNQGPDDYKRRDRTSQGPDDERAPDPTRRPDR